MSRYTPDHLQDLGCAGMDEDLLNRTRLALTGFEEMFGAAWIDMQVVVGSYDLPSIGRHTLYVGETALMPITALWEDWSVISELPGAADALKRKLAKGPRFDNVDLEISVAAEVARNGARLVFEPTLPSGRRADFKFQIGRTGWTWVEVTRRSQSMAFRAKNTELAKAAGIAATRVAANAHGTVVVFNPLESERILTWLRELQVLPAGQTSTTLDDAAMFFLSPAGGYDPSRGLELFRQRPHMYMSQAFELPDSFGTMWGYLPDLLGCQNKIHEKNGQMPADSSGLIVVDVSVSAARTRVWHREGPCGNLTA